jgi:metal-responsive CopG/Arc/MetJ family transcriptional regulator
MATHRGYKTMLGVSVKPEIVKALDEFRGEVPRSRVVERALNEYLSANTITRKNLQGSRIGTPASQAEATTTPTQDATAARTADNVIGMTTNGGRRTGDVEANGK